MKLQWQDRWQSLLHKTQRVETQFALEQVLDTLAKPSACHVVAFVNAHAMNSSADSLVFYQALSSADTLFRDGSGMAILYRMLHLSPGLNLNGTDLIPQLISRFNGCPIALYGTQEPYLTQASAAISKTLADSSCIDVADGFSDAEAYIERAKANRPALIVLGMGMPKQEAIARMLQTQLDFPCLVVCGGAIIDFLGGKTQRAPRLLRALGLEWIFRLFLEPRRLFTRYVVGNPTFLMRAAVLKVQIR